MQAKYKSSQDQLPTKYQKTKSLAREKVPGTNTATTGIKKQRAAGGIFRVVKANLVHPHGGTAWWDRCGERKLISGSKKVYVTLTTRGRKKSPKSAPEAKKFWPFFSPRTRI